MPETTFSKACRSHLLTFDSGDYMFILYYSQDEKPGENLIEAKDAKGVIHTFDEKEINDPLLPFKFFQINETK